MTTGPKIRTLVFLLLFLSTFFLLILNTYTGNKETRANVNNELFDPKLQALTSTPLLIQYIDSLSHHDPRKNEAFDTAAYVNTVSDVIKRRFFHGLSNYSLSDNWIAKLSGTLLWSHLSAIVDPDGILKYSNALCSQQNIVFVKVLKAKGITFRSVGLGKEEGPGHYLSEVYYGSHWHLYDVDREPNWEVSDFYHMDLESLLKNKEMLHKIYKDRISEASLGVLIKDVKYGKPNVAPAQNMLFFHKLTLLLTYILPLFFLYHLLLSIRKNKKIKKSRRAKQVMIKEETLVVNA